MSKVAASIADSDCVAAVSPITLMAADRYPLSAHCWHVRRIKSSDYLGVVVINSATGVRADYYHRYARFLAEYGYVVLTYDYRGIGASRQGSLRHWKKISTSEWGRLDCEAALAWAHQIYSPLPLYVVAHSIGGMLVGFAPSNRFITRCVTFGAQFGYWPDYARKARFSMWFRWHITMPLLTALCGYCPAKAMRWHEDLPAAAAYEWAFRCKSLESTWGAKQMPLENFSNMTGDIIAIEVEDDAFGTPVAINRLLTYFRNSRHHRITISPKSANETTIGHFGFFHDRFRATLWKNSLVWLSKSCSQSTASN